MLQHNMHICSDITCYFLNVQSDVPYKTVRITHELRMSINTFNHLTSNDSVKSELQLHKELQAVVHLSSECSSSATYS